MRLIRLTRTMILGGLLAMSLALNVATVAFSSVAILMSSAYEIATGAASVVGGLRRDVDGKAKRTIALSDELQAKERKIAKLSDDLSNKDRRLRDLGSELEAKERRISGLATEIEAKDRRIANMSDQLSRPKTVSFRGKQIPAQKAVEETAGAISSRASKSAAREIASMPGEAIPYFGTAVIVAVTALEIQALCETIKDMNALQRAFNPDLEPLPEELTVCSKTVPSRQEIWDAAVATPGRAWAFASEKTPTLEELRTIELPSWGSMVSLWQGLKDTGSDRWVRTKNEGEKWWHWMTE